MSINRELVNKRSQPVVAAASSEQPYQSGVYQHSLFITRSEKEIIDLIRTHEGLTKGNLVSLTDYSRTKISSCIDSLLQRKLIIENDETEYSGGRRSRTYSINGGLVCSGVISALRHRHAEPISSRKI